MINNDKLKEFSEEMLKEIKDLKDLTKEELPKVAQEYIFYKKATSLLNLIFCSVLLLSVILAGIYLVFGNFNDEDFVKKTGLAAYCLITGIISIIGFSCSLDEVLSVFLQPRRTAIYAITSLFNGDE